MPPTLRKVGGKGANLGELTRAGFSVPPGFCVTTAAFHLFMGSYQEVGDLYVRLEALRAEDVEGARLVGHRVRERLRQVALPGEVAQAVVAAWQALGREHACALRSSATAEDLPDASFAGQQDTFLNVRGERALLESAADVPGGAAFLDAWQVNSPRGMVERHLQAALGRQLPRLYAPHQLHGRFGTLTDEGLGAFGVEVEGARARVAGFDDDP